MTEATRFCPRCRQALPPRAVARSLTHIVEAVAAYMDLTPNDMRRHRRATGDALRARKLVMYLAVEACNIRIVDVARYLGQDHSTIIWHANSVGQLMKTDRTWAEDVANIREHVGLSGAA